MASVTETMQKARLAWEDMGPRAWFLASNPGVADLHYRINPALALCAMRKGKDVIVLPGGHDPTREFADFAREVFHLHDNQIRYTEDTGSFLVESNHAGAVDTLKKLATDNSEGQRYMLVPAKVSNTILKWLPQVQSMGMLVYGDNAVPWRQSSAALLHRSASELDQASSLEEVAPEIRVPAGYVCCTHEDLLIAFSRLEIDMGDKWKSEALLRPVRLAGGGGHLLVNAEQELRLYDFPHGPVVLQEAMRSDVSHMGLPCVVTVPFIGRRTLCTLDVMRQSNGSIAVIQTSMADAPILAEIEKWSKDLLTKTRLAAAGAGVFEYVIVGGEATLVNASSGFHVVHFPALFAEKYMPEDASMMCWSQTPAESLDVWTYWYRLYDNGLTFRPTSKRSVRGIFPLLFNKNAPSLFMAVAKTMDELQALQVRGDALTRDSPTEEPLDRVGLDDNVRRIWCGSARPEYRRETQRYNLPNRCISLVRKDLDFIILPGNHSLTRQYWEFSRDVRGLKEEQALFTSNEHFVMDDDVDDEIIGRIRAIVTSNPKDKFTLVPYCVTANFERWSGQLKELDVTVFGDTFDWVNKYGHKGILHRHIKDLEVPSIMEEIAPNVRVARGYGCSTVDHLLEAHRLLGGGKVVIKPVFGAAGEGIIFVDDSDTLRGYDFPMGDIILEEFLDLDRTADGIVLSPAVHYLGPTTMGDGLVDQIMVGTSYAGWRRSQASKMFQQTCSRAVAKMLKAIKPQGPGGFDFLSVEGAPFLTDVNTGRFNGAHFPKLFHAMVAPAKTMYCFKFKPPSGLSVMQFWQRLLSADLAFVPGESETGVYPLVYLRGLSGLYIVFAATERECVALATQAKQFLTMRSSLTASEPKVPKPIATQLNLTLIQHPDAVYGPDLTDCSGLLLGGRTIVGMLNASDTTAMAQLLPTTGGRVFNAHHMVAVPGFIDPHVHITGGGGEKGPSSRTPELTISQIVASGITTLVGVTGTDSISRSLENLLTKARALEHEGITTFIWSGAYRVPTPTLTGSPMRDLCLVEQCIGVGEIAIADHRGSQPTVHDLEVLASECHVGGMLGGKAGIVHVHMGKDPSRLHDLHLAVRQSALPITCFYPTHMSRSKELVDEGMEWILQGGYVDFTAGSGSTVRALTRYYASGVNLEHITISSDAGGSCPTFDTAGNMLSYKALGPMGLMDLLKKLTIDMQWPLERSIPLFTSNAAKVLKLEKKGRLEVGMDADIILLDSETLAINYVFAKGEMLKGPQYAKKGMFDTFSES